MTTKNLYLFVVVVAACVTAVTLGYLAVQWASKGYQRFLQQQARAQVPVGVRDPVLSELKAKMFGAGYEVGRAADFKKKHPEEEIAEKALGAAKELGVGPKYLDICLERYRQGFLAGLCDSESLAVRQRGNQTAGE